MKQGLRASWMVAVVLTVILAAGLFHGEAVNSWVYSVFDAVYHREYPGPGFCAYCQEDTFLIELIAYVLILFWLVGTLLLTVVAASRHEQYAWLAGVLAPVLLAVVLLLTADWLASQVGLGQPRVTLMILGCTIAGLLMGLLYSFVAAGPSRSQAEHGS